MGYPPGNYPARGVQEIEVCCLVGSAGIGLSKILQDLLVQPCPPVLSAIGLAFGGFGVWGLGGKVFRVSGIYPAAWRKGVWGSWRLGLGGLVGLGFGIRASEASGLWHAAVHFLPLTGA